MTEAEYRALDIDSYSSLKVFIEDRKKYYKKFVLRESVKEDDTPSTIFGSLVDCLLFSPQEFEERYTLAVSQVPTGQYGKFVDELMKVTLRSLNEDGEVTRDIDDMMLQAYNAVKYDSAGNIVDFKRDGFEVVKSKFFGTDLETRYRELRESYGKTIVELKDVENATAVVNELKSNFVTKKVMTQLSDERFDVYHQLPIVGDINGYIMKCLIDKLVADNHKRTIFPLDFKTAWDNENEFITNYYKYKYYVQNVVYYLLVLQWVSKHEKYKGYYVEFPRFIAAEANNYKNPLIYTTKYIHHKEGRDGFRYKEKWNVGVFEAIEDLKWHKNTGIWNISRKNFEKNGIIELPSFEYLNTA